jgi:pimeloyl-ACP methyl ester carboxylesterase
MQRPELPAADLEGAVAVSGYTLKLNYQCFGEGSPTVLVEAGGGDQPTPSGTWNAVILGVQPATRICIYDRLPVKTVEDGAEHLHLLLTTVPVEGPYIVVAHSLGGWYARVFTHLYPDEVAGLILVDTTVTSPEATIIYATAYPTFSPDESDSITKLRFSEADIETFISTLPSIEGLDMIVSNDQVREAGAFGDIPLVVIAHTPGKLDLTGVDPTMKDQYAAILVKVEADQVNLSPQGVFVQAATTEHFISEYEPELIIDTILQMVAVVQNK